MEHPGKHMHLNGLYLWLLTALLRLWWTGQGAGNPVCTVNGT